jgi:hypothetical protein
LAQEKPFIHFTDEDGLPGKVIRSITKDNNGYLWIGTDNGLSKFDGTNFKNFKKNDGLANDRTWALASDNKNRLFIGCYAGGLSVMEDDKIVRTFKLEPKTNNTIRNLLYSERHNILVIGTDFGIYILKDTTIYSLNHPYNLDTKAPVMGIVEYKQNIYFTAMNVKCGLYKIEINDDNIGQSEIKGFPNSNTDIRFTLNIINDTVYTNINYEILELPINNLLSQRLVYTTEKTFLPWSSCRISDEEILYGGWGGGSFISDLRKFNIRTKELTKSPYNIDFGAITSLVYDEKIQLVWVGTFNGLFALPRTPFEFYDLSKIEDIIDVAILNDIVYILTEKGIYTLKSGELKLFKNQKEISKVILGNRNNLYKDYVHLGMDIFIDHWDVVPKAFAIKNHELYYISSKGTIQIIETGFGKFLPFDSKKFLSDGGNSYYFIPDYQKGRFYRDIEKYEFEILESNGISVSDITDVAKVDDNYFFVSHFRGIFAIKDSKIYTLNESNSDIDNFMSDIDITPNGEVWCISSSGNLFNIGFKDSLFIKRTWNENNSDIVGDNYKWLKFNDSNLYIGTNKCLAVIPTDELYKDEIESYSLYNKFNGYPNISTGDTFIDSEGNLYLFSSEKLIKIQSTFHVKTEAKFVFSKIELNGFHADLNKIEDQILPSTTNKILIESSLIKYPSSKNTVYSYRLNGGNWEKRNYFNLESIRPGNYEIEFEALDNESGYKYHKKVHFEVSAPFYQRAWFVLLIVIMVSILTALLARVRLQTIKNREREKYQNKLQTTTLQIQALQSQMNPHFIFNSLNSIQNFILSSQTKEALIYLGALGKLIRGNLENVSEEFIPLYEEIEFLKNYISIEKLRFKRKLHIDFNNQISDLNLLITPMLIQPVIENAIKHGIAPKEKSGKIIIDLKVNDNLIVVTVHDDGVGRKFKKENANLMHNGKGLELIKKRIDLSNSKYQTTQNTLQIIDLQDKETSAGTKVIITLEIHKDK